MKTRVVQTRFWKDEYIKSLSCEEKLVFMFLITNETVNLVGTYQVYPQEISLWCDISLPKATQCLEKFHKDKKIFYKNGWIKILNHSKYQNYGGGTQEKAYQKELEQIPEYMLDKPSNTGIDTSIDSSIDTTYKSEIIDQKSIIINQKMHEISQKDKEEIAINYQVPIEFVESKFEDMVNYCQSTGKKYKDYVATLRNWVKRDRDKIKMDRIVKKPLVVKIGQ